MTPLRKKLLIEVGAFDGADSLRMYHQQGYSVYTFEPKTDLYIDLKARTDDLPDYTVINKAVSIEDGETTFYICREGGASSILPFKEDEELEKYWSGSRTDIQFSGTQYQVSTTRLDTFLQQEGLASSTIDYLHCDAQGVDLDVLKSLGKYIGNLKEGVIECASSTQKSIYKDQTNTLDVASQWLLENGFEISNVATNDCFNCEYNIYFRRP